jgi:hypothetical protein
MVPSPSRLLPLVLLSGPLGCRLIAGIHDIELTDAGLATDAEKDAIVDHRGDSDDAGPCDCINCQILAKNQELPLGIQIDGDDLYWVDFGSGKGTGAIMTVPKAGGTPTVVIDSLTEPYGLQIDANNFYWAALDSTGTTGQLMKMPRKGGAAVTLATGQPNPASMLVQEGYPNLPSQQFLAVSDSTVYYVTFATNGNQSAVWQVPIAGGTPAPFLANLPGEAGVGLIQAYAITLSGSSLYVICDTPAYDGIIEAPLSGAAIKEIVSDLNYPVALAVTGSNIIWTDDEANFANGLVNVAPSSGVGFKSIGKDLAAPWALLIDPTTSTVYWANNGNQNTNGSLQKAPLDGSSEAVTLVPSALAPEALAMDSEFIYWVDAICGGVLRTPK